MVKIQLNYKYADINKAEYLLPDLRVSCLLDQPDRWQEGSRSDGLRSWWRHTCLEEKKILLSTHLTKATRNQNFLGRNEIKVWPTDRNGIKRKVGINWPNRNETSNYLPKQNFGYNKKDQNEKLTICMKLNENCDNWPIQTLTLFRLGLHFTTWSFSLDIARH